MFLDISSLGEAEPGTGGFDLSKSSEQESLFTFAVQKMFNLQVVSPQQLKYKNVVCISKEDYKALFPEKQAPYVLIANHVYRVMPAAIQGGWMSLYKTQQEEISEIVTPSSNGFYSVVAMPFDPKTASTYPIKTAEIAISEIDFHPSCDEIIIISKNDFKNRIKEAFTGEFLCKNRACILGMPWGVIKAEIFSLNPTNSFDGQQLSYGLMDASTRLIIHNEFSSKVVLVDEVYREEVEHFKFEVSIRKRLMSANADHLPLVVYEDSIIAQIMEGLTGKLLCKNYKVFLPHLSGWDVIVTLTEASVPKPAEHILQMQDRTEGYVLSKNSKIYLNGKTKDLLIAAGESHTAKEILFEIKNISSDESNPTKHGHWIDVNELNHYLRERKAPFVQGEVFEAILPSGKALIKTEKIGNDEYIPPSQPQYTRSWMLGPSTTILTDALTELGINFLRSKHPLPLSNASFVIKLLEEVEKPLQQTLDEIKRIILSQGPERLSLNQSFNVTNSFGKTLQIKLTEREAYKEILLSGNESFLGAIDALTEMDFSIESGASLVVIERVYHHEIDKFLFSIKAIQRKDMGKFTRAPLVLDLKVVREKIEEELKSCAYFLEGRSFTYPFGKGWDIEIAFERPVLNAEARRQAEDHRTDRNDFKTAYTWNSKAAIDFSSCQDVLLTEGEPVEAASIYLSVVEIIKNKDLSSDSQIKGSWINLEELKSYLTEMGDCFAQGQQIPVQLQSGKFMIEVKSVKGVQSLRAVERKKKLWKLTSDTKFRVESLKSLNLQTVKNRTALPLQKIEFIVEPQTRFSDLLILEAKELKQALAGLIPHEIVYNQKILLETSSHDSVRLRIKKMTALRNKRDLIHRFGVVTPETELVFRGKANSNLIVNTSPEILDVKDPIKYLEDLGVGGLNEQFGDIMRIFTSRGEKLKIESERRGLKPIKGILFYGPPGTGKTSLARLIGRMLGCDEGDRFIKINGTDPFNKWFGESEKKIRELFAPAKAAQKKFGKKSPLFIICIDEIDALLIKRGTTSGKVKDSIVNAFLGEMDGLETLENILVFGITNRKDEMDEAALRHGRFGIHAEIGLPNKEGRLKIFEIYTRKLQEEGLLGEDVDLSALAEATDQFSGAAIEGLVVEASHYSLKRLHDLECSQEELKIRQEGIITMKDFEKALKKQRKVNEMPEGVKMMYL